MKKIGTNTNRSNEFARDGHIGKERYIRRDRKISKRAFFILFQKI